VGHCGSETHSYRDEIGGNIGGIITNGGDKQGLSRVSSALAATDTTQCSWWGPPINHDDNRTN
jgi:hypothetical protein